MDAGAYTQRISIEKLSHNYDSIGNPVEEWKPFKKTYAYMNGLSGKEYWEAAVLKEENTVDFVCRWKKFFDEIDVKIIVLCGEEKFLISRQLIMYNSEMRL